MLRSRSYFREQPKKVRTHSPERALTAVSISDRMPVIWRKTCRSTGASAYEVWVDHQPEDRKGVRTCRASICAGARRRSDRV